MVLEYRLGANNFIRDHPFYARAYACGSVDQFKRMGDGTLKWCGTSVGNDCTMSNWVSKDPR
jgi:hypothetical protein